MEKYIRPTPIIDSDNKSLKKKANELTRGWQNAIDMARDLFYFVRDEITYDVFVPNYKSEHFQASNTLVRGKGFCIHKAVLLVALGRAVAIPSRLCLTTIKNHLLPAEIFQILKTNIFPSHAYAELYLEGKWVKATPAFDLKTCNEHKIIPVEFDGCNDAMLHRYNQEGKLHIEYLEDRGHFDDVPLDEIRKEMVERNLLDPKQLAEDNVK